MEMVFFSAVEGRLVSEDGTPAAGVRVSRTWQRGGEGERGEDDTTTDAEGRFSFPEVTRSSFWAGIIPHTPVIGQTMTAHLPDGELRIWLLSKNSYDRNSELGGRATKIVCRVDKEPDNAGPVFGTCMIDDA
ncbi:MAG: carboxypeptidase-like regulatory domain-containing protein [Pseudomonadota bacterium]